MLRIAWWCLTCFYTGREVGAKIDLQNRDVGGKPKLVQIPWKWQSIFKQRQGLYMYDNKILKASVLSHLLGYTFAMIELILFVIGICFQMKSKIVIVADSCFFVFILVMAFGVLLPDGIRYEKNMQKAYDYDWITSFQEALTQKSKRKCTIISVIDERTCEIEFLKGIKKHRFYAETEFPVEIGEIKYALHYYHPIDEDKPYWIIKNY